MKKVFSFLAIVLLSTNAFAAVWNDTNTWNDQWEQEFSRWVQNEFHEDMFMVGKYKGIKQDCADAVYFARLIFAYENKLPFVIHDATGGPNKISNKMSRWDGKSETDKVRALMELVVHNVSTKTLPRDTYPVKISREFVKPGVVWVRPSREVNRWNGFIATITGKSVIVDPGHAEVIKTVNDNGTVKLIGSTTPAAVRRLTISSSFLIMPESKDVGIRNWMRPAWYGKQRAELPGYSLEQFKMGGRRSVEENDDETTFKRTGGRSYRRWREEIQDRLKQRDETREEAVQRYADDLCSLVRSRADVVQEALTYKAKRNGGCLNESEYDAFSTPTRDKRINASIEEMLKVSRGGFGSTRLNNPEITQALSQCPMIQISESKSVKLQELLQNVRSFSSDPNDSLEARWGFEHGNSRCPKY